MDLSLEDVLFQWTFYNHPALLQDPELFEQLLRFIHAVLATAVREERAAAVRRTLKPSSS